MFDVLGRINELRNARKWSVFKLAQFTGIPQSTIATWYQKNLCPPIDKLEMICDTFHISLAEFFSTGQSIDLTEEQLGLINKWNILTDKQKQAVDLMIDVIVDK